MKIIFDIDGVLADCSHRLPFIKNGKKDWDSFFSDAEMMKDAPISLGCELFQQFDKDDYTYLWLVTGRPERTRETTKTWLKQNGFDPSCIPLLMREDGDYRPAFEIKKEHVKETGADLAIDDDPKNCRMYVELGVPALLFMSKYSSLWEIKD